MVVRVAGNVHFCRCRLTIVSSFEFADQLDGVSVPSPMAIDMLIDIMAKDRAHMYLFSV